MGLYSINCPICGQIYNWFSGNIDQRCYECRAQDQTYTTTSTNQNEDIAKEDTMDYEQLHLDSLNKIISVQSELISFLKAEIDRLKTPQININPPPINYPLGTPANPQQPYYTPPHTYPAQEPFQWPPGNPPYVIISTGDVPGTTSSGSQQSTGITGTPLPPGSVQTIAEQHTINNFSGDLSKINEDLKNIGELVKKRCKGY